jgi:hypothetical protein
MERPKPFIKPTGPKGPSGNLGLTRRQVLMLGTAGGLWATGIVGPLGKRVFDEFFSVSPEKEAHRVKLENEVSFDTGFLAGRPVNGLFAYYLGCADRTLVLSKITISPAENIKKLWAKKLDRKAGVTEVAKEAAMLAEQKYHVGAAVEKISFGEYVKSVDAHLSNLRAAIDFEALGKFLSLEEEDLHALKVAAKEIGGREIVAYSMTELLPGADGEYNAKFFDLILSNYGVEYLHWVPALYDEYTSFGPYQFTKFALYDAGGVREGASRINQFVKDQKYKIPGSVIMLEGHAHDRAAYMFALFNIAMLIKETETSEEVEKLIGVFKNNKDILVGMIACMHNLPVTKHAFMAWIKAGANGMPSPRNVSYLGKSVNNYRYIGNPRNSIDYRTRLSTSSE